MAIAQAQSTEGEEQVRLSVEAALLAQGGTTVQNVPGNLTIDVGGTVGKAYLAGGFRDKMKMPMRVVVTTAGGVGGTGISIDVHSRGTAGGFMSGGVMGSVKQGKAEQAWLRMAWDAVPQKVQAPAPGGPPPA
ncbi:MAG: hypothetical protein ACRDH8_04655 [Actinomycetota bacterium]